MGNYRLCWFLQELCAKDFLGREIFKVIAAGRRKTANVFSEKGVQYISVDIIKAEDFNNLLQEACICGHSAYMDGYEPLTCLDSIIYGTCNVLEYYRKANVDRLLFSTPCFDVWEYPKNKVIMSDEPLNYSHTGDHAMYAICRNAAIYFFEDYKNKMMVDLFLEFRGK